MVSGLALGVHSVTIIDVVNTCSVVKTFTIAPTLALTVNSNSSCACAGTNFTLSASPSGGIPGYVYSWTGGPNNNVWPVTQSAGGTYIYTATVTDGMGCSVTKTISLIFMNNPVLHFSGAVVCQNAPATITASGATSYTWLPSYYIGSSFPFPSAGTIYTVTGSTGACASTNTVSLLVSPPPVATILSNPPFCVGQTLTLVGSGGVSYQWTGPFNFSSANQTVTINGLTSGNGGQYALSIVDANSCQASAFISVNVQSLPVIHITGNLTVCNGQSVSLTASGASSYTWSTNAITPVIIVNPGATTAYTVAGANSSGCVNHTTTVVNIVSCTGINETNEDISLKIYPNPNSGNLTIETDSEITVFIFDALGKIVFESKLDSGKNVLDLSKFSNGVYIVKSSDGKHSTTLKFVKAN